MPDQRGEALRLAALSRGGLPLLCHADTDVSEQMPGAAVCLRSVRQRVGRATVRRARVPLEESLDCCASYMGRWIAHAWRGIGPVSANLRVDPVHRALDPGASDDHNLAGHMPLAGCVHETYK